jgi:two-component system, NarL family, sensor kinase
VAGNSRRLLRSLAVPLGVGLALLWLTQLPLARSLASKVRAGEAERATLLEHAVTASQRERERIAADLHDDVVQDLAGLSYELEASAARAPLGPGRDGYVRAAQIARVSLQRLRFALVDLHPPAVHAIGLAEALEQLAVPLRKDGAEVTIEVDLPELDSEVESLLYRTAKELLRNVHEHAHAAHTAVNATVESGRVVLRVQDDGCGFSTAVRAERVRSGHVGLELQNALVRRAGGYLTISSTPGSGTTATVEIPQ